MDTSRYENGESGIELIASQLLQVNDLVEEMGWPAIVRVHRQMRLAKARTDLVCEHVDGSVTLIEVKCAGLSLRDYCTGIGQLAYQAVMAASYFGTPNVRRVLALPGPVPIDLAFACTYDKVDVLPLPTAKEWVGFIEDAERDISNGPHRETAPLRSRISN